jgi:ABC-type uncharacterized transport system permease subunit
MPLIPSVAAIFLYAAGFYLRWRQRDAQAASRLVLLLALAALAAHALVCYSLLRTPNGIVLSVVSVSNLVALVLVGVVALANLRLPVENLYIFLFPISILTLLATMVDNHGAAPLHDVSPTLLAHILISLAAYSALMMAAVQSVMLAVQERHLKAPGKPTLTILPPLETMEHLLVAMLWIGLVLLSASILSGYFFLEDVFHRQVLHHIVLTSLSWVVYVFFLGGRYLFGWRGLTAVRWTLSAFALLVLGYLGSKFVLEYLL